MNSRLSQQRPAGVRRAVRAFTLIELMVAMAIVAVLVAIALPAFNAARRTAKRVSTEAMISVLSTGLEQFKADSQFGGQYPPSALQSVISPHTNTRVQVGGASFLAWALAGADMLGTPGFRDLNGNKGSNDSNIALDVIGGCTDDTGSAVANGVAQGLYAINGSKPWIPRSGPYVEPSKVKTPKWNGTRGGFELAVGARNTLASICFLDAFEQPILYYKANPTAQDMIAAGSKPISGGSGNIELYNGGYGTYAPTGVYNLLDNGGYLNGQEAPGDSSGERWGNITGSLNYPGVNLGGGTNHFNQSTGNMFGNLGTMGSFTNLIGKQGLTPSAPIQVQNANTYILLSAGVDGVFGTLDDVANFPVGK